MTTQDAFQSSGAAPLEFGRLHERLRLHELLGGDEPDPLDGRDRLDLFRVRRQKKAAIARRNA